MDKSPDAFRTISEAAEELDLPQHVLRFWETRFPQIKPLKRGGGRRYYRPDDVQLLKGIRHLLYDQGFTIKGVQRILKDQGMRHVAAIGETGNIRPIAPADSEYEAPVAEAAAAPAPEHDAPPADDQPDLLAHAQSSGLSDDQRARLQSVLDMLERSRNLLDKARES